MDVKAYLPCPASVDVAITSVRHEPCGDHVTVLHPQKRWTMRPRQRGNGITLDQWSRITPAAITRRLLHGRANADNPALPLPVGPF
jgi:hypothetical protein